MVLPPATTVVLPPWYYHRGTTYRHHPWYYLSKSGCRLQMYILLKGGTRVSGWRPKLYKQISQHARSTAERAIGWTFIRCEASLFEDRECPIFYGHGRKIDMILFLLVRFLIRFVGRFGCDNSPVFYGCYLQVIEVLLLIDSIDSIWGIERANFVYQIIVLAGTPSSRRLCSWHCHPWQAWY